MQYEAGFSSDSNFSIGSDIGYYWVVGAPAGAAIEIVEFSVSVRGALIVGSAQEDFYTTALDTGITAFSSSPLGGSSTSQIKPVEAGAPAFPGSFLAFNLGTPTGGKTLTYTAFNRRGELHRAFARGSRPIISPSRFGALRGRFTSTTIATGNVMITGRALVNVRG